MDFIETSEALEALYGTPSKGSQVKVAHEMTPTYRQWIMASKFCILSTVGPDGTDGTPRGDDGPVVTELDARTLAMPDWSGNNRIDSLRNIVQDPRASLMFMVPGSDNVVRVNGEARITADDAFCARFEKSGKRPRTVLIFRIHEIYVQCAKALMRSKMWSADDQSRELPTIGDILKEMSSGEFGGAEYDRAWPERAERTLW